MTSEKLNEIIEQLKIEKNIWYTLYDVESIKLKNGKGIYPNWKFLRFLFTDKEILIQHGDSEPYGARLSTKFAISSNRNNITFSYGPLISPVTYHHDFRNPKIGDIIVASDSSGIILSESIISNIIYASNGTNISLVNPITMKNDILLSFYDPKEFNMPTCVHGTIVTGVYFKFKENPNGIKYKKYGVYHESIKYKDIVSIELKLVSKKTFTAK